VIQPGESYALLKKIREVIALSPQKLLGGTQHTQGLYVADNRTLLVQRFLESECDWLLQIDTDIAFEPTLLEEMLELAGDEKKILAASVPLGEKFRSCAFMRDEEKVGGWRDLWPVPLKPIECDAIATACCLIHREVFETIADQHGQCWFHHIYLPDSPIATPPRDFKFLSQGEDIAFSVRAARTGFKMWAVHVPGIRHHKTRSLSHDDDRARMFAGMDSGVGEIVDEGVVL
jgi:hypothetical protein